MKVEVLAASQCQLGEGPLWHAGRFYWFDILQKRLHHCAEDGGDGRVVQFDEHFSAAARLHSGGLLLASETGLWRFEPHTGLLTKHLDLEADNPVTRSNDGRADRHGGFWMGTMGKQAQPQAGAIYRYYQGKMTLLRAHMTIANSICFSPDGATAYFADTVLHTIFKWALDAQGWPRGEPEIFVDLSAEQLSPDGSVVDSQGFLWNAQWGSSRVVRYAPDGRQDSVINVPVSQPSCPAFGGADLKRMIISSARVDLTDASLALEPLAGNVLTVQLPVAGCPEGVVML